MSDKTAYSPDIRLKKQVGENEIDKHTGRLKAVTGVRFPLPGVIAPLLEGACKTARSLRRIYLN